MRDEGTLSEAKLATAQQIVEERFATLRFPIAKEQAIASVGDAQLPADLRLGDILRGLPDKAFHDPFKAARAADERVARILRAIEAVERAERSRR